MPSYEYVDNAKGEYVGPKWIAPTIFKCSASTISEADVIMQEQTGLNPSKSKYIGVTRCQNEEA